MKTDSILKKYGIQTAQDIKAKYKREAEALPLKDRKTFLENFRSGMKVGECMKSIGLTDHGVVCQLILNQYKTAHFLKEVDELE